MVLITSIIVHCFDLQLKLINFLYWCSHHEIKALCTTTGILGKNNHKIIFIIIIFMWSSSYIDIRHNYYDIKCNIYSYLKDFKTKLLCIIANNNYLLFSLKKYIIKSVKKWVINFKIGMKVLQLFHRIIAVNNF